MAWYNVIFRVIPHKHSWKYKRLQSKRVCLLCGKEQQKFTSVIPKHEESWKDTLLELSKKKSWWIY